MARTKKGEVNKSQAIRDYLAENKRAKAPAIVAGLEEKGITVGAPLVYSILRKAGGKRRKTTRGAKTTRGTNGNLSLETLLAAKKLADALGGIEKAKAALDVLGKLA
jgi:hypothetical protein